ncbi:hypothetical protein F4808DRAFT_427077 [Astrocystis sublimbata]|nr:hypothetical protein F4808DRAFT_427077 [Astrocystis sublimbata]
MYWSCLHIVSASAMHSRAMTICALAYFTYLYDAQRPCSVAYEAVPVMSELRLRADASFPWEKGTVSVPTRSYNADSGSSLRKCGKMRPYSTASLNAMHCQLNPMPIHYPQVSAVTKNIHESNGRYVATISSDNASLNGDERRPLRHTPYNGRNLLDIERQSKRLDIIHDPVWGDSLWTRGP